MRTSSTYMLAVLATLLWTASSLAQDTWDTDMDGYDDNNDNCTLIWNDDQRDTDGDFMGNMCDADFNGDHIINFGDFSYLGDHFLTADPDADLNGDGTVNFGDISQFATLFLSAPGPTGVDPEQPPCTCYFSGDCDTGTYCNYGPGSWATEDICAWRDVKPGGNPGTGCSIESNLGTGEWTPDICDGVCKSFSSGSMFGLEETKQVAQAVQIWGAAMMNPSAAGGGPVDPILSEQVLTMQFRGDNVPFMLGRYTADALAMSAGDPFHDYFCHYEGHPDDPDQPVVNLADDACRVTAGELTIQGLVAELNAPGTARGIMSGIQTACPGWQTMFTTQCDAGPNALNCAIQWIENLAFFLSTPAQQSVDPVQELLGSAVR
ncbi:MAG: hypothetical protein HKN70_09125 [Gammaproteobacteria bacterium]|nr:hypothetical protein [Gammaproteobacteria bacterium]